MEYRILCFPEIELLWIYHFPPEENFALPRYYQMGLFHIISTTTFFVNQWQFLFVFLVKSSRNMLIVSPLSVHLLWLPSLLLKIHQFGVLPNKYLNLSVRLSLNYAINNWTICKLEFVGIRTTKAWSCIPCTIDHSPLLQVTGKE